MFRANNFDKLLDKATSNLRLDPDWPSIIQICDLIRQNDCSPKYAVAAVKKKLYSQNPHQAMFALLTLESVVKNCGSGVHEEVTSKVFCEMLRDLVKSTQHENLRSKILELIQAWAFAFRNNPKYRAVQDTVNILKAEGYKFPPLKESDAMFSADTAPEWADGEVCHRCRVAFSLMVRRHHCRACGQVFCQQCSSKTSTLPKFGIEKEVRVCDACYDKVSRPPTSTAKLEIVDTANDYGPTQPQKRPGGKTAEELQEEEELQLALALSQSEAEQKEKERERRSRVHIAPDPTPHPTVSPTPSSVSASPEHNVQVNSELSRYLDRNYWEQRLARDAPPAPLAPTAPSTTSTTSQHTNEEFSKPISNKVQEDDTEDKEIDEFVESLKSQVEIFVNRMKSNSSRGRSIANDTAVQTLFMNITAMHSQLLRYIQQQDDKRVYLESLQDKVAQVRDSRAALDTLRAEHAARVAAQAEAADRQRQMQMAAKLQAMRKKKHEYLQYQRQLALQRVQEQEREMQMRQEQQKHQYMMSNSGYYLPGVSLQQFQPGYPNQPMYANPQFHPQMLSQVTTDGSVAMPGQPQMSTANMPIAINQMGAMSQPQLTNAFAMSTSGVAISQAPMSQPSMNQSNVRPVMSQPMPGQQQMILPQMHQMRMQPGMHQMMPQNIANGLPGQNVPQHSHSQQIPKQNLPNQSQLPNTMMTPMAGGQPNLPQLQMNPNNPMAAMQMQNMRLPMMQNQSNNNPQVPVSGYPLNIQQNGQPVSQSPNIPQQQHVPAQQMSLPNQMMPHQTGPGQNQSMSMPSNIPQNQTAQSQAQQISVQPPQSQMTQAHHMSMQGPMQPPGQDIPGHPMNMQGSQMPSQNQSSIPQQNQMLSHQVHQIPHPNQISQGHQPQQMHGQLPHQVQGVAIPQFSSMQGQMTGQSQQIQHQPSHAQQVPQGQQGHQNQQGPQGHQMPQSHQVPQGQHMPQGQMSQAQQMPQGQIQQMPPNVQGQPMKIQQNFSNGPPPQQQGPSAQGVPQDQQGQTGVKSEHNNNTAELISFD